jgi:REP-associated tyrosine transposase
MLPKRPRLNPALYVGIQRYLLTFCTDRRLAFFTTPAVVETVKQQILEAATQFRVAVIAFCFMPDHVHLLVEGESAASDILKFVHQAKQRSGYAFAQRWNRQLWQRSFHDYVLRDDDATISVARYVIENPLRARLAVCAADYPFLGSARYTMKQLLEATCWQP